MFHLCSQSVEGGGHRLRTELYDSLTEDDAGAEQHNATGDGGDHDGQDQWCRDLVLWRQPLRSCQKSQLLAVIIYDEIKKTCLGCNYVPVALMQVTLSLVRTSSSSHIQMIR